MSSYYKVLKLLGEGSYGKAFLCKNESNGSICVIKQIIIEGMNKKEIEDVYNEANILEKLDHQNIIKFYEIFNSLKPKLSLNIVTEYADGGNLSEKIKKQNNQPFKESEILDYFTQICLALKHIHEKKIIHRDLKSGNVFLMKSGLVKLGDFGISKKFQNTLDKAKTMIGTPYYLSPEIIDNKPYDSKIDIWSLGVLLYEMMTFKMPFNANSLPMLSIKILNGTYPPPPKLYTPELREIVSRCLNIDPAKRPSIQEILKTPIIRNRIKKFLDQVEYNKEFSKTIAKKYKENKMNQNIKIKEKKIDVTGHDKESAPNIINNNLIKIIGINKVNSNKDKPKVKENFKMMNSKEEKGEKEKEKKSHGFKDFLNEAKKKTKKLGGVDQKQFNESGAKRGQSKDKQRPLPKKTFKDDEASKSNELKELLESYDVNKITEEQYDKLRFLNNLNKEINEEKESDNEEDNINNVNGKENKNEIKNNTSKIIIEEGVEVENLKEKNQNIEETDSDDIEEYSSKLKDLELMRRNLEKCLGLELFKAAYHCISNDTHKKQEKYDRDIIEDKLKKDLVDKGLNENEINNAIQKIPEIFSVIKKERDML